MFFWYIALLLEHENYGILCDQLQECADKWEDIAKNLGFTAEEITKIKSDYQDSHLGEMIRSWLYWTTGDARGSKEAATLQDLKSAVDSAGYGKIALSLKGTVIILMFTSERQKN